MNIYDYINLINDTSNIIFTVFDCYKEELVSINTEEGEKTCIEANELQYSDFSDYEVESTDIWIEDGGDIHIEINIDTED